MKTKLAVGTFAVLCLLVLNGRSQDEEVDLNTDLITEAVPERISIINEYVLLATKLANRMTEEELEAGIDDMKHQLAARDANDELNAVQESLQQIIDSHPGTEAAARAQRALDELIRRTPEDEFGRSIQGESVRGARGGFRGFERPAPDRR